jgi:hypothetical protein|tara:strand:+ start:751 stop:933 length:183 start_codon:yes stop_codon:yes gene_type:complete
MTTDIKNHKESLEMALRLSVTAPTDAIASVSPDAATFDRVWQDDCWWLDDTVAANGEIGA